MDLTRIEDLDESENHELIISKANENSHIIFPYNHYETDPSKNWPDNKRKDLDLLSKNEIVLFSIKNIGEEQYYKYAAEVIKILEERNIKIKMPSIVIVFKKSFGGGCLLQFPRGMDAKSLDNNLIDIFEIIRSSQDLKSLNRELQLFNIKKKLKAFIPYIREETINFIREVSHRYQNKVLE